MEQLSELSTSVKVAGDEFRDSWTELRKLLSKNRSVNLYTIFRAGGSVEDILGLLPVLIEIHEKCHVVSREHYKNLSVGMPPNIIPFPSRPTLEEIEYFIKPRREFAACLKAMFFFVRAFQDVLVGILFELKGKNAGRSTSMSKLLKPKNRNTLRHDLESTLPDYVSWFYRFKEIRDKMKYGINVSHGFETGSNGLHVFVHTGNVYESESGSVIDDIDQKLSLQDVLDSLKMSKILIQYIIRNNR